MVPLALGDRGDSSQRAGWRRTGRMVDFLFHQRARWDESVWYLIANINIPEEKTTCQESGVRYQ